MKSYSRRLGAFLALAGFACLANAQETTNPPGGLTIQTLQVEDGGWAFVQFEEADTVIENNCQPADTLFGTFPRVLWLDPAEGGTQGVLATLLALQLANEKVSGITLYNLGSYCTLYALRTQ